MHELSIIREVIDSLVPSLQNYPGARIVSVSLSVGVHSGVDPDSLRFVFPLASEGTRAEGAQLLIETVPLQVDCPICRRGPMRATTHSCPVCGSTEVMIVAGRELIIQEIEVAVLEPESFVSTAQRSSQDAES